MPSSRLTPYALRLLTVLCLLALPACSRLPVSGPLPPELAFTKVSLPRLDDNSPLAWGPAGDKIALADHGLAVIDLTVDKVLKLTGSQPAALAWSPDGRRLVAAFIDRGDTVLKIFALDENQPTETRISGRVHHLTWGPAPEIRATAVQLKDYSFAWKYEATLISWDGENAQPAAAPLHSVMIRPQTINRWGDRLFGTCQLVLSPLADEMLYTRLHEPPANDPFLKIILRHLDTGVEREVGRTTLAAPAGIFAGRGEEIIYWDGLVQCRRVNPWTGQTVAAFPALGRSLAISPAERYLFVDNRLLKDGQEIATFTTTGLALFSPAAGRLLIQSDGRLYLLTVPEEPAPPRFADQDSRGRFMQLRKLRALGLITTAEYEAGKLRILSP